MARSIFSLPVDGKTEQRVFQWFRTNGYDEIQFVDGDWKGSSEGDDPISHNLKENIGFRTFVKHGFGGSLFVFEVHFGDRFQCECYSPLLIFGFFKKELAFKGKPGLLTKYLKDGYSDMKSLTESLSSNVKVLTVQKPT